MKKLPLPLVMLLAPFGIVVASFLVKRILTIIDEGFADTVSGLMLTTIAPAYSFLRNKQIRNKLFSPDNKEESRNESPWIEKFTLRWYLAILYGTVTITGIFQIISGLAGIGIGLVYPDQTLRFVAINTFGLVALTLLLPVIYFMVGKWIGMRSDGFKAVALITTVILERILNLLLVLVIPAAWIEETLGISRGDLLRDPTTWGFMIFAVSLGIVVGLIGVWRGHRVRMDGYLQEIFRVLPIPLQEDIVGLAYDEAQRILLLGSQAPQLSEVSP